MVSKSKVTFSSYRVRLKISEDYSKKTRLTNENYTKNYSNTHRIGVVMLRDSLLLTIIFILSLIFQLCAPVVEFLQFLQNHGKIRKFELMSSTEQCAVFQNVFPTIFLTKIGVFLDILEHFEVLLYLCTF